MFRPVQSGKIRVFTNWSESDKNFHILPVLETDNFLAGVRCTSGNTRMANGSAVCFRVVILRMLIEISRVFVPCVQDLQDSCTKVENGD